MQDTKARISTVYSIHAQEKCMSSARLNLLKRSIYDKKGFRPVYVCDEEDDNLSKGSEEIDEFVSNDDS